MLTGGGFFGQSENTSPQDFLKDFRNTFESIYTPRNILPFPLNFQYGATKDMIDYFGNKEKKDPETDKKKGTYGGLDFEELERLQKAGFEQQDALLRKGMIVNAGKDIGRGFMAGPQAYLQNVLPQMFAGNAAVLSAGASGTGSLANVYRMPPVQIRKQGFYS